MIWWTSIIFNKIYLIAHSYGLIFSSALDIWSETTCRHSIQIFLHYLHYPPCTDARMIRCLCMNNADTGALTITHLLSGMLSNTTINYNHCTFNSADIIKRGKYSFLVHGLLECNSVVMAIFLRFDVAYIGCLYFLSHFSWFPDFFQTIISRSFQLKRLPIFPTSVSCNVMIYRPIGALLYWFLLNHYGLCF